MIHDTEAFTVPLMQTRQIGHDCSCCEHSAQQTKCPHGRNTVFTSASIHTLHVLSSLSFSFSFNISVVGTEPRHTDNADDNQRPFRKTHGNCTFMLAAGLCFFLCRTSFNNGWTDRNAECCVNTVNEKLLRLRIWWTLVKGRCHGNQSFGLRRRKLTHPRLHFVRWHFTTVKKITRKTCNTRRHLMNPLHLVKILWTFVQ